MMSFNNPPVAVVVALTFVVVIFLMFRDLVCWYWKINRMVELLESIDATLRSRGGVQKVAGRKALRLDPNHPEIYSLEVGSADNQLGKYQKALTALKVGIPNDSWTHVNLAYTYEERRNRSRTGCQKRSRPGSAPRSKILTGGHYEENEAGSERAGSAPLS
jgi:hypothetical protein